MAAVETMANGRKSVDLRGTELQCGIRANRLQVLFLMGPRLLQQMNSIHVRDTEL